VEHGIQESQVHCAKAKETSKMVFDQVSVTFNERGAEIAVNQPDAVECWQRLIAAWNQGRTIDETVEKKWAEAVSLLDSLKNAIKKMANDRVEMEQTLKQVKQVVSRAIGLGNGGNVESALRGNMEQMKALNDLSVKMNAILGQVASDVKQVQDERSTCLPQFQAKAMLVRTSLEQGTKFNIDIGTALASLRDSLN
jgi:prefoldin subunit 5